LNLKWVVHDGDPDWTAENAKRSERTDVGTKKQKVQPWIGLAEVTPKPWRKDLIRGKGAFVAALALASSVRSFDKVVCKALNTMGFKVPEISDIEPLLSKSKIPKSILALEKKLSKTNPVVLGTFHSYKK
jgi:hypothetical protein